MFDTAVGKVGVYICYDRHFPEGWRALGLNGADIVFNPSATSRGLSAYLWKLEQPASAVANEYYIGAINRVGIEPLGDNDFYGTSYFVDPEGKFVGDPADDHKPELIVRDLDMDLIKMVRDRWQFYRDRRPDAYDDLVASERERTMSTATHPHHRTAGSSRPPASSRWTCSSTARRSPRSTRPARRRPWASPPTAPSTPPASTSSPAASTCTRTWSCPSAARSRRTRSRPAHGPRRGAAPRRSSTSPCRPTASNVIEALGAWHEKADGNCAIDYGFHQIIGGVDDEALKAMDYLVDHEGITSFKLFMAYPGVFYSDDGQILRAMQKAAENGAVIMMHAENGIAIDVLIAQALARGETDPSSTASCAARSWRRSHQPGHHAGRRWPATCPLYIVHMSASEAVEAVAAGPARRAPTCSARPARSTCT